jgi:hypothetical protein
MGSGSKRPPRRDGVYVSKGTVDDVFGARKRLVTPRSEPRPVEAEIVVPPSQPPPPPEAVRRSARPTPPEPNVRPKLTTPTAPKRADPRGEGVSAGAERIATDIRAPRRPPSLPVPVSTVDPRIERADRLCLELEKCGPGDEAPYVQRFRSLSDVGLSALEASFPGLLWFDRSLPHQRPPRGRSVSPIASILITLGLDAVPTVARLLHSDYEEIRYYAALVAVDMGAPALVPVLAELALDEEAAVRRVALEGLIEMRETDACHLVCRSFERRMVDPKWRANKRALAIKALTTLRWPGAIAPLINLLELLEPGTPELARGALRTLTTQDFALRQKDWRKWHAKHGTEPRKAWLLAGLVGTDGPLRDFAASELMRTTGKDFGYLPGAELKECKRIQKLYAAL